MSAVVFVKFGGSLITEKTQPFTVRRPVIERLAREVAAGRPASDDFLILGHGSGSFGHVAAARTGLLDGDANVPPAEALSRTQQAAARLHRHVVEALRHAELPVYSFAPSSAFVAAKGEPVDVQSEPLRRALAAGALPVTFGDVVLDRERDVTICSTETVFDALIRELATQGVTTSRVLWLGDTDGVYDADGHTIDVLTPDGAARGLDAIEAPRGVDVTGGMHHRVRTALALARLGVSSYIIDGQEAGHLQRALRGEDVGGTRVLQKRPVQE